MKQFFSQQAASKTSILDWVTLAFLGLSGASLLQQPNFSTITLGAAVALNQSSKRQSRGELLRLQANQNSGFEYLNRLQIDMGQMSSCRLSLSTEVNKLQEQVAALEHSRTRSFEEFSMLTDLVGQLGNYSEALKVEIAEVESQVRQLNTSEGCVGREQISAENRGRVAIFVDIQNQYHCTKKRQIEVDYSKLLQLCVGEGELALARCYLATTEAPGQRPFLTHLERSGFELVTRPLVRHQDGSADGNLDGELITDLMDGQNLYDTVVLVSGDGDFAYTLRMLKKRGIRVEVLSFREAASGALIREADQFIDLDTIQYRIQRSHKPSSKQKRVA
jgi:uncharacterized LabA/DUF88 family protein